MIFTSIEFAIFCPIIFLFYWLVFNRFSIKISNIFLIVAGYGWWNWRICFLLFGVTVVTWLCGYGMDYCRRTKPQCEEGSQCKNPVFGLNLLAILFCIGILGVFKYYDFFTSSFAALFTLFGQNIAVTRLGLILPVGISFYIFQSLTYTIDIYKRKLEPTDDIIAYFAFMSFFPQLLSGPISRASRLIPQFEIRRKFNYDYVVGGFRLILWGLFMKVCVADRLAIYVDTIYGNLAMHNGTSVALAAIFYSIQIYCDFAGYSYMAIGCGRLFGIGLDENFHRPYFAGSVGDFWRRWHISLSTWFRDYVYIPLGGNRVSRLRNYFNLFVTFLISGLWHGAAWTFVFWGGLHGIYQISDKIRKIFLPSLGINQYLKQIFSILITFVLVTVAWVFFRLPDIDLAFHAIGKIVAEVGMPFIDKATLGFGLLSLVGLVVVEIIYEYGLFHRAGFGIFGGGGYKRLIINYIGPIVLILWIVAAGVFDGGQFIYFQF